MMWISILEAGAGGGWVCVCGEGGTSLALLATGKSWMLFEDGIWDFMVAIFMKAIDIGFEFAIDISFEFWQVLILKMWQININGRHNLCTSRNGQK
jgi:hypothetical protein